jgi:putative transposase
MPVASDIHRRRSIRLPHFDYSQNGTYFVTICTWRREPLFGDVVGGEMRLNEWGQIVRDEWLRTESLRPNVELDAFVAMPNHFHGIIVITERGGFVGAQRAAPLRRPGITPNNVAPGSLGAIIRSFKSAATRRINRLRDNPGVPVWQRNYYERVIRDDAEWNRIREYVTGNPANWADDENHPDEIDSVKCTSTSTCL